MYVQFLINRQGQIIHVLVGLFCFVYISLFREMFLPFSNHGAGCVQRTAYSAYQYLVYIFFYIFVCEKCLRWKVHQCKKERCVQCFIKVARELLQLPPKRERVFRPDSCTDVVDVVDTRVHRIAPFLEAKHKIPTCGGTCFGVLSTRFLLFTY